MVSHAAITCTGESFTFATPSDPQAQDYTVPSVTDGITVIGVTVRAGTRTVSSVTIGGDATTQIGTQQATTNVSSQAYYRLGVTSGTKSISVNFDIAPLTYVLTAATCGGVDQTTPIASSNGATGDSTTPSVTCTGTTSGQKVLDFPASNGGTSTFTVGSGQTFLDQASVEAAIGGISEQDGGGDITMSHTTTTADWGTICAVLNAVASSRTRGGAGYLP